MRSGTIKRWVVRSTWLACCTVQVLPALGDEPSRLGRLFRLGASSDSKSSASASSTSANPATPPTTSYSSGSGSTSTLTPTSAPSARSVADYYGQPALSTPPTTSSGPGSLTPTPRITPKPRVNKAITEADPLVSRIAVGKADGGSQFGMFLQVFADGTVIDGSGVHKISPEVLKPVVEAVTTGDFGKIKGHCGGPAGDTFENIHVVTYERAYGRLRANAFSYSGNPQGCDHAVHHLHKILEDLQMKLDNPGAATTSTTTPTVVSPPMTAPVVGSSPALAPMSSASPLAMPGLPDPGLH